jgi:hypothetical protein
MPKVICPNCEFLAADVSLLQGKKFYCPHCGWNVDVARSELRSSITIACGIAVIGVILAIVARIRNPGQWAPSAIIILAFSGLPIFWAASAWVQLRKLGRIASTTSAGRLSHEPTPQKRYPELAGLARPRKLRTTWRGTCIQQLPS